MEKSLTILVPVYNEEDCISPLYIKMNKFLDHVTIPVRVLFIDDGSSDDSLHIIESICAKDRRYSYVSLDENSGLSAALKAGIDQSASTFVGYIDADLQTTPDDFTLLLEFMSEYDLVTGYRINRKDSLVKRLSSLIANSFRQWLLKDQIIDSCCPLKIIRTDIARRMPFFKGMHRFIPDMVMLLGGEVKQIPVRHYERHAGKAKYNLVNRMVGPLIDTFVFRWMQRNIIRYRIKKLGIVTNHEALAS